MDAPTASVETTAEKRLDSTNRNTLSSATNGNNEMVAQGEMLNSTTDDEDDGQLGLVQRTFRRFNFRDHQANNVGLSHTLNIQTHETGRVNSLMRGSTPTLTIGISTPPITSAETASSSSSNGSSQQSVCQHHQTQAQHECCCKAAKKTAACTSLNPHHDAQRKIEFIRNNKKKAF